MKFYENEVKNMLEEILNDRYIVKNKQGLATYRFHFICSKEGFIKKLQSW